MDSKIYDTLLYLLKILREPEKPLALLILLLLTKRVFPLEYNTVISDITSVISIHYFINILSFLLSMLFLLSVLYDILAIIMIILDLLFEKYYMKIGSKDTISYVSKCFYSHFYGTQANAIIVFSWLVVVASYLFLVEPSLFNEYITKFYRYFADTKSINAFILFLPKVFYIIILFVSFIKLFDGLRCTIFLLNTKKDKQYHC